MKVRPMEARDVDDVLVMAHRFRREWAALDLVLGPMDEDFVRTVIENVVLNPERGAGWLACVEDEPVGMLIMALVPNLISGERSADELVLWVDPRNRAGSAGGRLLQVAVDWARQNRATMIKLVAPFGSPLGTSLARRGWLPVETSYIMRL